jgi:hypothetical protein
MANSVGQQLLELGLSLRWHLGLHWVVGLGLALGPSPSTGQGLGWVATMPGGSVHIAGRRGTHAARPARPLATGTHDPGVPSGEGTG